MTKQSDVDLSEFEALATRVSRCWRTVHDFTAEQAAKIDAAMKRPDITGTAISAVLDRWGFRVAGDAVQRHRLGKCSCGR